MIRQTRVRISNEFHLYSLEGSGAVKEVGDAERVGDRDSGRKLAREAMLMGFWLLFVFVDAEKVMLL